MYEKWIYRLREDKVFPLSDTPVDQFKEIREADQRVFIDFTLQRILLHLLAAHSPLQLMTM